MMGVPTEAVYAMDAALQKHAIYLGRVTIAELLAAVAPLIAKAERERCDHIPDTGKMVPDAWVEAALAACRENGKPLAPGWMQRALAAVAPMIAKAERERCARELEGDGRIHAAAAIRALGDKP